MNDQATKITSTGENEIQDSGRDIAKAEWVDSKLFVYSKRLPPGDATDSIRRDHANLVVDIKTGVIEKSHWGPVSGKTEGPLTLTDRLLLQASDRFSFRGEDQDGVGFEISVDLLTGFAEFWGIVLTDDEVGQPGYFLVEHEAIATKGYFWLSVLEVGQPGFTCYDAVSIEETRDAVLLALLIAQGAISPTKLGD